MGQQVNFYFSDEDERALSEFFEAKGIVCIPRVCSSPQPEAIPPSQCHTLDVKLIPAEFIDEALKEMSTPNRRFWHLVQAGTHLGLAAV